MSKDSGTREADDDVKLQHEGWTDIKDKKRGCTDILCLFILIAAWVAMTIVGFIVTGVIDDSRLKAGNPARLFNPIDYNGDICGYNSAVKNLGKGYYLPDRSVVCVSSCPKVTDTDQFICRYDLQSSADNSLETAYELVVEEQCMYEVKTKEFVNRCVPNTDVLAALDQAQATANSTGVSLGTSYTYDSVKQGSGWFSDFLADLWSLRGYVFGFGIGVAVFLAFVYLLVLRIPGLLFFTIWLIVLSVLIVLLVLSILLYLLAEDFADDPDRADYEVTAIRVFSYIGFALTGLYFCLIIVLRKRIQLAIGVVKETARVLGAIPVLIIMPILQTTGIVIFLIPWIIYVLYLASSGTMTTEQRTYDTGSGTETYSYRTFEYDDNTRLAFLYMIFCLYWSAEFIIAVGQITIALSIVRWYFTREKNKIGNSTMLWAYGTVNRYHLGTAAYGSLIIAIIRTIRTVLAYIQRKAKNTQNKCVQYCLCTIQCCLWCLEKCMKFINKNAYILTAIYGYSFCKSARKAFFLLLRNILRVAAVNMVGGFVLLLGKILVPTATTVLAYFAIVYGTDTDQVTGVISPLIFTFLIAYYVADMFTEVFGMGIDTILMCFIADEEMFDPVNRFAEGSLATTVQKTAQDAASNKVQAVKVEPKGEKVAEAGVMKSKNEGDVML